jgi:uncharacterized membrane protein YhaH (DUF805 family)
MGPVRFFCSFKGRIGRVHYWSILLAPLVLVIPIVLIADALGATSYDSGMITAWLLGPIYVVIFFSGSIRRWHDLGRTGWWQLLAVLPFGIGVVFILFICGLFRGDEGANAYGPPPALLQR